MTSHSFDERAATWDDEPTVARARAVAEIIADESHHARYVRALLDRWAQEGWGDAVREAEEATARREAWAREWAAERLEAERLRAEGRVEGPPGSVVSRRK